MTKTKWIIFCGAFAGLMLVLSGCASTSERSSTQSLKAEAQLARMSKSGARAIPASNCPN